MAEFSGFMNDGFERSGQILINDLKPGVPPGGIQSPEQFFQLLHAHGFGTTNGDYVQDSMRRQRGNWGAYWLVLAASNHYRAH